MTSELLTTAEAARYIRKSTCWLLANRKKVNIPSLKIGGEYRYRRQELDQWLDSQRAKDYEQPVHKLQRRSQNRKIQLV